MGARSRRRRVLGDAVGATEILDADTENPLGETPHYSELGERVDAESTTPTGTSGSRTGVAMRG